MTNREHNNKREQGGDPDSEHITGPEEGAVLPQPQSVLAPQNSLDELRRQENHTRSPRPQERVFPGRKESPEESAISMEMLEINRELLKATRLMARGTIYGILVGAVAAVAFFLQFCAMSQQTKTLRDQAMGDAASASLSAVQTQDQLRIAQKQANSARDTITTMRRQMTLYERAWVGTSDNAYTITENGPIGSSVFVKNTGKSPAMDIVCRMSGITITKPRIHVLKYSDITYPADLPITKQGTLFPGQRFPLSVNSSPTEPKKQKVWFENIQKGDWIQYFFGEVQYKDIFGKSHWTHFCSRFVPATKSGTPCPIYNGTDNDSQESR